jgi:hypothetical protein
VEFVDFGCASLLYHLILLLVLIASTFLAINGATLIDAHYDFAVHRLHLSANPAFRLVCEKQQKFVLFHDFGMPA